MEEPKMGVKKYFIAIVIPEPFFGQIEAIKHDLQANYFLKGALRSPAHITLHRPFEWKEEKENILIEKLNEFKFHETPEVVLSNFSFFEPRVIYVNVLANESLRHLYEALRNFTKKELGLLNEWDNLRGFHPHVTIANRDLKKTLFYELKGEFASKKFDGSFNCNTISLLKLDNVWKEKTQFSFTGIS